MFATAGFTALRVTQSIPATTCSVVPSPDQSSTRTDTTFAFFATPNVVPARVPATCVPCPCRSSDS